MKNFLEITPFKIGLALTLFGVFLVFSDPEFLQIIELKMLDQRLFNRGELKPGPEVVIVAIDEKSQDVLGRWPWPRSYLGKLVDSLAEAGAATVGFDMVFSETGDAARKQAVEYLKQASVDDPSQKKKILDSIAQVKTNDEIFAASIQNAENVVLGLFFHDRLEDVVHLSGDKIREELDQIASSAYSSVEIAKNSILRPIEIKPAVENNLPLFADAAYGWGFFNTSPDKDGVNRHYSLIFKGGGRYYPPLFLKMIAHYTMEDEIKFFANESKVYAETGGIQIPANFYGSFLINYYGGSKTFPHISASDVIQGRVPKEMLEGRIVLVGATGTGIFDLRATPFEQVYPGVEIIATIIDNILQNNYLREPEWSKSLTYVLILTVGFGMALLISKSNAVTGFLFTFLAAATYYYANQQLFNRGLWVNLVYPTLQIVMVYISITIFNYLAETRQKKYINNAFGQYLSPTVVKRLIDNPDRLKLGGELKRLTAFFSDIAAFSTFSEQLSPTQLVDLLNEYLSAMTEIVLKYEGTIDKYEGDAIIAFFGAPLDYPDHAARACLASLEMQNKLALMREEWKAQDRPELTVRIGLNTGAMIVGNMGSTFRMDYTIMGDSVNLASRLEGVNKVYGTSVMISQFTYEDVKDVVEARELDKIRVMGKREPVAVFEVLAPKGEMSSGMEQAVSQFKKGLALYREQSWDAAMETFREILKQRPHDAPSQTFLKRCEDFKAAAAEGNGLPKDWDGVYQMTSK